MLQDLLSAPALERGFLAAFSAGNDGCFPVRPPTGRDIGSRGPELIPRPDAPPRSCLGRMSRFKVASVEDLAVVLGRRLGDDPVEPG